MSSRVNQVQRLVFPKATRQGIVRSCEMVNREADPNRPDPSMAVSVEQWQGRSTGALTTKSNQDWLYDGGVDMHRHPDGVFTDDDGREYYDPLTYKLTGGVKKGRRKHESNFLITLNTNKRAGTLPGAWAMRCKEACQSALHKLSNPANICRFTKFGPVHPKEYKDDVFEKVVLVEKTEFTADVEVGPQTGAIHAHIWLGMHHYSQLQVNVPVIKFLFKTFYNQYIDACAGSSVKCPQARMTKQPYCWVKLLPLQNWGAVIKRYIHKDFQEPTEPAPPS